MDFKNNKHIDIEVLRRYYQKEMTSTERNSLEQRALNDPFLKDAMDGFDAHPGSFNRFYTKHSSSFRQRRGYTLLIGISVLLVFFIVTTLLKMPGEDLENDQLAEQNLTTDPETIIAPDETLIEIEQIPEAIDTLQPTPKTEQISVTEIVTHQTQVEEHQHTTTPTVEHPIEVDEEIGDETDFDIVEENVHKPGQETVPSIYMHDLWVVNYQEIRRENVIGYKRFELSGLPASEEHSESDGNEMIEREVQVPYHIYLLKSMSFFTENQFKKALNRYQTILEQYPEDANALFYGGLSYYNLGKYTSAINTFDQILNNDLNAFKEEANWYKAKALIQQKEQYKAIDVLNNIIAGGGFYTEDAIALKKTLAP